MRRRDVSLRRAGPIRAADGDRIRTRLRALASPPQRRAGAGRRRGRAFRPSTGRVGVGSRNRVPGRKRRSRSIRTAGSFAPPTQLLKSPHDDGVCIVAAERLRAAIRPARRDRPRSCDGDPAPGGARVEMQIHQAGSARAFQRSWLPAISAEIATRRSRSSGSSMAVRFGERQREDGVPAIFGIVRAACRSASTGRSRHGARYGAPPRRCLGFRLAAGTAGARRARSRRRRRGTVLPAAVHLLEQQREVLDRNPPVRAPLRRSARAVRSSPRRRGYSTRPRGTRRFRTPAVGSGAGAHTWAGPTARARDRGPSAAVPPAAATAPAGLTPPPRAKGRPR